MGLFTKIEESETAKKARLESENRNKLAFKDSKEVDKLKNISGSLFDLDHLDDDSVKQAIEDIEAIFLSTSRNFRGRVDVLIGRTVDSKMIDRILIYDPKFFDKLFRKFKKALPVLEKQGKLEVFLAFPQRLIEAVPNQEAKRFAMELCMISAHYLNEKILSQQHIKITKQKNKEGKEEEIREIAFVSDSYKIELLRQYQPILLAINLIVDGRFLNQLGTTAGRRIVYFLDNFIPHIDIHETRSATEYYLILPYNNQSVTLTITKDSVIEKMRKRHAKNRNIARLKKNDPEYVDQNAKEELLDLDLTARQYKTLLKNLTNRKVVLTQLRRNHLRGRESENVWIRHKNSITPNIPVPFPIQSSPEQATQPEPVNAPSDGNTTDSNSQAVPANNTTSQTPSDSTAQDNSTAQATTAQNPQAGQPYSVPVNNEGAPIPMIDLPSGVNNQQSLQQQQVVPNSTFPIDNNIQTPIPFQDIENSNVNPEQNLNSNVLINPNEVDSNITPLPTFESNSTSNVPPLINPNLENSYLESDVELIPSVSQDEELNSQTENIPPWIQNLDYVYRTDRTNPSESNEITNRILGNLEDRYNISLPLDSDVNQIDNNTFEIVIDNPDFNFRTNTINIPKGIDSIIVDYDGKISDFRMIDNELDEMIISPNFSLENAIAIRLDANTGQKVESVVFSHTNGGDIWNNQKLSVKKSPELPGNFRADITKHPKHEYVEAERASLFILEVQPPLTKKPRELGVRAIERDENGEVTIYSYVNETRIYSEIDEQEHRGGKFKFSNEGVLIEVDGVKIEKPLIPFDEEETPEAQNNTQESNSEIIPPTSIDSLNNNDAQNSTEQENSLNNPLDELLNTVEEFGNIDIKPLRNYPELYKIYQELLKALDKEKLNFARRSSDERFLDRVIYVQSRIDDLVGAFAQMSENQNYKYSEAKYFIKFFQNLALILLNMSKNSTKDSNISRIAKRSEIIISKINEL